MWSDLLGDAHANLHRTTSEDRPLRPWETDDLFYHSQGYAHAIGHCMRALEREYAHALAERPVLATLFQEVGASLAAAATFKPVVVLDGSPAGLFANHRRNLWTRSSPRRARRYTRSGKSWRSKTAAAHRNDRLPLPLRQRAASGGRSDREGQELRLPELLPPFPAAVGLARRYRRAGRR